MVSRQLTAFNFWDIKVSSPKLFTQANRDFIIELVSEESRKVPKGQSFILHDAIESAKYCRLLVEAPKHTILDLRDMLKDNIPYRISLRKLNFQGKRKSVSRK